MFVHVHFKLGFSNQIVTIFQLGCISHVNYHDGCLIRSSIYFPLASTWVLPTSNIVLLLGFSNILNNKHEHHLTNRGANATSLTPSFFFYLSTCTKSVSKWSCICVLRILFSMTFFKPVSTVWYFCFCFSF